jgi:hypothetical protein
MPNRVPTVVELLADRQNIGVAWEVWKTFPTVIDHLQVKLWRTLDRLTQEKSGQFAGWQLVALPKRNADLLQQWFNLRLLPRQANDARLSCQFAIEQYKQSRPFIAYQIYFGIRWSEETPRPPKSPEYETLSANLKKDDFSKSNSWIGYKYLDFKIGDDPYTLERLASGDEIEEELASEFVSFVSHYANGAQRLNKVLTA